MLQALSIHLTDEAIVAAQEAHMPIPLRQLVFTLLLASLCGGCADLGPTSPCPCGAGAKAESSGLQKAPGLSQQRLMLSEGYSLLYADAVHLDLAELILYVKVESDKIEEIVTAVGKFGGELKEDLERIARDYPGVRIDLDPLPEMEKRKRQALGKDRALYFTPGIGHGGREYELTVLIALSNALNHERHMCQVMAEEEPDPGLKKFLTDTQKQYDSLYDRTLTLLKQEYLRNPEGPSK